MVVAASRAHGVDRLASGVERLGRAGLHGPVLVRRLAGLLRAAVPSDGLLLLRTDPTTVLPTDGVAQALPPALCRPFWDNELLEDDVNKFVTLARSEPPAATLREATDGDLSRSRRFATLYHPLGFSDELRVSFPTRDGSCWGIAQLVRARGATFTRTERDLLARTAPAFAAVLRAAFAAGQPVRSVGPRWSGPALVILDGSGEIESITPGARAWLAELATESATGMVPVPEPVYAVAARARAAGAGIRGGPARAQLSTDAHGWLHLHASCLDGPDGCAGRSVAVVITPAHAPELLPLLALGYRLTGREREVLQYLARGMTTAEITQLLGISSYTVRDHIKALFGKVGVRSRAELVARVFAEHYFDRLETDVIHL